VKEENVNLMVEAREALLVDLVEKDHHRVEVEKEENEEIVSQNKLSLKIRTHI
jgi:hypothetical protein